ncbi:MAG: hypothetical protein A2Y15_07565 [Clostridiales bacterium GWF2_36_10]|nr:MAG: hypothetical protein A2Y15_07565 [Clostridiales bacterium GWF2_36_10]
MSNVDLALHSEYLIKLLRASLNKETVKSIPEHIDLNKIYYLAKLHSVTPTVYPSIEDISSPFVNLFKNDFKVSWRKNAIQYVELSLILSKADEFNIDCIPLKGSVMKDLYPSPEMRTMADLDFLFDQRRIDDVNLIMYSLGYTAKEETVNHFSYYKEPVMNVEFHPNFFDDTITLASFFNPGWRYAKQTGKGIPIRKLTNEGFYIYLIAHIIKHFKSGGAGIRSVMDVWVFLSHFEKTLDWSFINQELKKAKIDDFSNNIYKLSGVWFGNEKPTTLLNELGEFIIKSGTYGMKSTNIKNVLGTENKLGNCKIKYIINSVFPSKNNMINYPFIKKVPFLLPIVWIIRVFSILFRQKKEVKSWYSNLTEVSEETVKEQREMFTRFGL